MTIAATPPGVTSSPVHPLVPQQVSAQVVVRALCRLGHVRHLDRLGRTAPLDASAGQSSDYACLFGRDSLRTALDLLDDFPAVARTTLRRLTALQGVIVNPRAEEEPGRILHEYRCARDPHVVTIGQSWDLPYYGTVDATPLYVILIGAYCKRHGSSLLGERVRDRTGRPVTIHHGLERALGWIDARLARDGYVCVRRAQPRGLENQAWDDSYDSYWDETGRLFDPDVPYAPVAVQAYAYDALLIGARLARTASERGHLQALATMLRRKVLADFWLPELGTFAPAVIVGTSGPRAARVVGSSAGHLLATRLLDGRDAAAYRRTLARRLLAPDLLAAAGIRTKSSSAARFQPGSYHNGSVWPMDTGIIAEGLRRHGYAQAADDLEDRILRACAHVGALAEFFRGDAEETIRINGRAVDVVVDGVLRRIEQPPQLTQAWTVTRIWRILRRRGLIPATTRQQPASIAA